MLQAGSVLWPKLRVLQLYGANTDVGKTIFSTILCQAFSRVLPSVYYLKPISTGPASTADDTHISTFAPGSHSECLYQFADPVSPHIAARSSHPIADSALQLNVRDKLQAFLSKQGEGVALVETAGGVLSPVPSGTSQADAYRPLRLPVLLLGDHKLGGISATISAWESLKLRGYDVRSVALFEEHRYENFSYLANYFSDRNVHTFSVDPPPKRKPSEDEDTKSMKAYYLTASQSHGVKNFVTHFLQTHDKQIEEIRKMPAEAEQTIWHPFLQHSERTAESILAIDSAYGDYFQAYHAQQDTDRSSPNTSNHSLLKPAFDGSASWWTQGLGHGNPRLALTAAHAAGRYGHVMFAGAIHEPALELAKTLLKGMVNPRLSKVFFTDNGSTGTEVAVKMALRAAAVRYQWSADDDVLILGLMGSYHGDTIGAMDCSEPSVFNRKVEWYRGRGAWLDFPQVKMRQGKWIVEPPEELRDRLGAPRIFDSLEQIFDFKTRYQDTVLYAKHFAAELSHLRKEGKKLGALMLEPIVLGAGGMMFADPLFQRCLVDVVRGNSNDHANRHQQDWSGMPVIFDEVFTGLYRLGQFKAASFLDVDPDIVVNAKLLTGGLVPLCTTTASQAIFDAFLSDSKSDALLHGHSYTAHAIGCSVANESLSTMAQLNDDGSWDIFKRNWDAIPSVPQSTNIDHCKPWSVWSQEFVVLLSHKSNVDYVWTLGSVLTISLKDATGSGYVSTAAADLRDKLLRRHFNGSDWDIHSRVLGNVLYLMAAATTDSITVRGVEEKIASAFN